MRAWAVGLLGFVAALCGSAIAEAQEAARGVAVRFGAGVARQGGIFGDDDPRSRSGTGVTVTAQVRGQTDRRTGLALDLTLQPMGVGNPHFDETLQALYVQVGPEIGRRSYVRLAGGVAIQSWSGSRADAGLGLAPAFGIAIGRRISIRPGRDVAPEAIARWSVTHGAFAWIAGVQVPFGWITVRSKP